MPKWFRYDNIWVRNIVLFLLLLAARCLNNYVAPTGRPPSPITDVLKNLTIFYTVMFINNYFIIRNFLFERKYNQYFILQFLYFILVTLFFLWDDKKEFNSLNFGLELVSTLFTLPMGGGVYFFHRWFMDNIINTKKKLLNVQNELSFLKHQLNPHFLLNAMNNLYGTALATPARVPEKIIELSDLLRYQIEASTKDFVSVKEEIDFIKKYLHYAEEKTNNLKIKIDVTGAQKDYAVPPLLFLPLVENAVKFSSEHNNPFIYIHFDFSKEGIIFIIKNNFLKEGSSLNGTGLGINNLKRRLEILSLKNEFTVEKNDDMFNAKLNLCPETLRA
jgi:hypothetical protein